MSRGRGYERDLRRERRQELSYDVWIETDASDTLIPCKLLDISPGGAGLQTRHHGILPDTFRLRLSQGASHVRHCRVAWRAADKLGVTFCEPPTPSPTRGDLASSAPRA